MSSLNRFGRLLVRPLYKQNVTVNSQIFNTCVMRYFATQNEYTTDPSPVFFNSDVQSLLKTLTRVDLNKVYSKRKQQDRVLSQPVYRFMTDEQLEKTLIDAKQRADSLLQMPPVVQVRRPIDRVLIKDSALQGYDSCKYVFTDVTFGVKDHQRVVVVRDTDGTLKEADWDVRDRINQVYFPKVGQLLKVPRMFDGQYLQDLLKRGEYKFILDRACTQFDPDNPDYHRVTRTTYDHVNENNGFEMLRSTRHFGSLAFYLTWFKSIDNLLLELIETSNIEEANILLKLYDKINQANLSVRDTRSLDAIAYYISNIAHKKSSLELALQAYRDVEQKRSELQHGIQAAHGNA